MNYPKQKEKNTPEKNSWFESDGEFNTLFPEKILSLASKHWTPVEVVKKAAEFLAVSATEKVLDIGSGVGKFCLVSAHFYPYVPFYGIEQRADLVNFSNELKLKLNLPNIIFKNENITEADLSEFDHFYFYNSFYENIEGTQKIDCNIEFSEKLYDKYNLDLLKKLDKKPAGTRLVTFHSFGNEIPPGYELVHTDYEDYLKFWIKL